MARPRILFTSPYIPNPKSAVREDPIDFFYYRNTLGQKMYQLRQMQSWHPLHYLAQNLRVPSVVLENPTLAGFRREVRRGGYDIVALTFTVLSAARVLRMATWVKESFPATQVILGGYGTAVLDTGSDVAAQLAATADAVCRGEGLAFLRDHLERHWGVRGVPPLRQSLVPGKVSLFRTRLPLSRQLCFLNALGCPWGCAFCATSAQYGRRKLHVVTPEQLYRLIRAESDRHPGIDSAIIYDEDFLADRRRVLEFMRFMEQDRVLARRPLLLTVFSSLRSVSQYSVAELVRCGIGLVFIGVESFRDEVLDGESLAKRGGRDIGAVFRELNEAGIHTLGSLILGWDGQTPATALAEIEAFVALNPTVYQVMPLQAPPGSPLWARMKAEGRLRALAPEESGGVTRPTFRFRSFTDAQVLELIDLAHRRLVDDGGPSVFKMFENVWHGWRRLRARPEPELQERARALAKLLPRYFLVAFPTRLLFRGAGFRARWRRVLGELLRQRPLLTVLGAAASMLLFPLLFAYSLLGSARHHLSRHGDQPETIRRAYAAAPAADLEADAQPLRSHGEGIAPVDSRGSLAPRSRADPMPGEVGMQPIVEGRPEFRTRGFNREADSSHR